MTTTLSPLLQEQLAFLSAKRNMLQVNKKTINTLAVGSSHGDFGFNPEFFPASFNACCRSQDLKHSYLLYKKITENNNKIRNVIVFYSIFSSGSELEKSPSEKEISLALNEIFNLNINYDNDKYLQTIDKKIKGKFKNLALTIPGKNGFFPNHGKGFFPEEYLAIRRAVDHLKQNLKNTSQIYLEKIIQLAEKNNHNLYILLPPARSDFKAAAGESNYLYRHLHKTLKKFNEPSFIKVINFYDDDKFEDSDFGDFDHLLPISNGTKYLSSSMEKIINIK